MCASCSSFLAQCWKLLTWVLCVPLPRGVGHLFGIHHQGEDKTWLMVYHCLALRNAQKKVFLESIPWF